MRWVGHVACMGKMRNVYKILVRKREGKRLLGKHNRRWKENIRVDVTETGWEVVKWIHVAQERDQWCDLVDMVMNLQVP
jgi:hypothetical protein